jgi:hypothetical protein
VPPDAGPTAFPTSLRAGRGAIVARLAATWWAVLAGVALVVALTGHTLPVGDGDHDAMGLLSGLDGRTATLLTAVLAAVATAVALRCLTPLGARATPAAVRVTRNATVAAAVVVLAGVALLTDMTVLARLGYLPAMLILAPFDAEFRDALLHRTVTSGSVLQTTLLVGAALLAVSTVRFARSTAGACASCGRRPGGDDPAWTTPASAARWGRVAAWVAAAVPLVYASTRLTWAMGLPMGLDRAATHQLRTTSAGVAALGLGLFAVVGAVLTLGLVQRWGEVFPRWVPVLGGRRVPISLAVLPASAVAVAVLPAGLSLLAVTFDGGAPALTADGSWSTLGPIFLWPLWSVALGAATYAYWLRRRGTCHVCGLG